MDRKNFDLILKDGGYWINCPAVKTPKAWQGQPVEVCLPLRGIYCWPWVGKLLRNGWAKRSGAMLNEIRHGDAGAS